MNLASPNVISLLRKRYDMIAMLLQTVPKAHHNLPKAIITHNSPNAIIVDRMWCIKVFLRVFSGDMTAIFRIVYGAHEKTVSK